ncbi:hypothetical protein NE639_26490, partial [Blautia producta]|nr:hypothetical protein [Blautia producta]
MKAGKGPGISGIIMLFLLPYLLTVIICGRKSMPCIQGIRYGRLYSGCDCNPDILGCAPRSHKGP